MSTTSSPTTPGATDTGTKAAPASTSGAGGSVPADPARAIIHLGIPRHALAEGESIDKAGYWLLVRVSENGPVRLSDRAEPAGLALPTVSRQMGALVEG